MESSRIFKSTQGKKSRRKRHATSWTRNKNRKQQKPIQSNVINNKASPTTSTKEMPNINITPKPTAILPKNGMKQNVWSALTTGINPPSKIDRGEVSITLVKNSLPPKPKYLEPFTFHPSMFDVVSSSLPAAGDYTKMLVPLPDASVTIQRQKPTTPMTNAIPVLSPSIPDNTSLPPPLLSDYYAVERTPNELLRSDHEIQPVCCKCWHGCSSKITEIQRQSMFKHFWSLDSFGKMKFLLDHMFEMRKKRTHVRPNGMPSRRKYSCEYYLDADDHRFQVCLNYFVKTLDISVNMVRMILKNRRGEAIHDDFEPEVDNFLIEQPSVTIAKVPMEAPQEFTMELATVDILDEDFPQPIDLSSFLEVILIESALPYMLPQVETQEPEKPVAAEISVFVNQPEAPLLDFPYSLTPYEHSAFYSDFNSALPTEQGNFRLAPVDCHCWNQCTLKISEKCRQELFDNFWNLESFTLRRQYLLNHVVDKKKRCIRSLKGRQSRRQYTCEYYLTDGSKRIQVCQRFFVKTLGISGSLVHLTLRKKRTFGAEMAGIDRRGLWRSLQADKEKQGLNHFKQISSLSSNGLLASTSIKPKPDPLIAKKTESLSEPKLLESNLLPKQQLLLPKLSEYQSLLKLEQTSLLHQLPGIQVRGIVDSFVIKPPISIIPLTNGNTQGVKV